MSKYRDISVCDAFSFDTGMGLPQKNKQTNKQMRRKLNRRLAVHAHPLVALTTEPHVGDTKGITARCESPYSSVSDIRGLQRAFGEEVCFTKI